MKWRLTGKYAAIIIAALMLSMVVLASGVSVMAATPEPIELTSIQVGRSGEDIQFGWQYTYNGQSVKAVEGDYISDFVINFWLRDTDPAADPTDRSRVKLEVKQAGQVVYTLHPASIEWIYYDGWGGGDPFWYAYPKASELNIPIPTDGTTTIITTLEEYRDGEWKVNALWTNYIGEAAPIIYGDYLEDVSLSFDYGDMQVYNGDTVKVRENGTLSGVSAAGMIGNGSKPIVYYDQTTSYLDVSLIDYKGNVVYSDIVWEMNKQQMPDSYYWRVEYGYMDIVQELLRFNEAYTIQIEMYTINEDWMTFTVHDRWTIYLDNEYVYTPPEDETAGVIFGALGFIGVIGFVGSPMLMAAMMRRGMDSYRAIPWLLMLMVASGVLAYVFLLGGD